MPSSDEVKNRMESDTLAASNNAYMFPYSGNTNEKRCLKRGKLKRGHAYNYKVFFLINYVYEILPTTAGINIYHRNDTILIIVEIIES